MTKSVEGGQPSPKPVPADKDRKSTWVYTTPDGERRKVSSQHKDSGGNTPHDVLSA